LAIVLTLIMLVGVLPMGAFAAPETDAEVPAEAETKAVTYTDTEGHWAQKSIDRWTEAKNPAGQTVLEGMGNNLYAPDDNLTRAQAMTIFSRLLNLVETADISKVTDVASDAWYAQWIEKGYAYEIIKGTSDTTFDPDGDITREQFFSIFARAMGIPGAAKLDEGKTFTDVADISSWFVDEGTVYAMINAGYLNGYPDGSLQPQASITRAEVAKVLDNAISDYITENGSYAISGNGIVVVLAKDVKLTGSFNGHIVSSCADSTLDLSGLSGTPYIYVLQDNTKIVNAKPGTKVAVNPAADNVLVNNVKVANPPYTPANPYIVPGATSIGGGGGGGYVGDRSTYQVKASLKFENGKAHRVDLATDLYNARAAKELSMEDVINELFGISGNAASENKDAIVNGYTEVYNRLTQDNSGDVVYKSWTSDEGYKLEVNVKDAEGNPQEGTIAFMNKTHEKTADYLDSFSQNFSTVMTKIANDADVPDGAMKAYGDFVAAVDPTNLFTAFEGNTYKVMAPSEFFDGYWTKVVSKGIALLDTLQSLEVPYDNYQTLFDSVFAATSNTTCNIDSLKGVAITDKGFVTSRNYEDGAFNFLSFDNTYTGAVNVLNAAEKVLTSAIVEKPAMQGFARLVDRDNIINLNGQLSLTIEAVKN